MLITGGTSSLGEELVKEFYNDYDVTFTYHSNLDKAKECFDKLRELSCPLQDIMK